MNGIIAWTVNFFTFFRKGNFEKWSSITKTSILPDLLIGLESKESI